MQTTPYNQSVVDHRMFSFQPCSLYYCQISANVHSKDSYFADKTRRMSIKNWSLEKKRNIHYLLEHNVLNSLDVVLLNKSSVYLHGRVFVRKSSCIHIYAFDSGRWPTGNWGDQLGPYITGNSCIAVLLRLIFILKLLSLEKVYRGTHWSP